MDYNYEWLYPPTVYPMEPPHPGTGTSSASPQRKSHDRKRSEDHIRRPPNAFMLYRSDFCSKDIIPRDVESKQQNISRVAADCWKRLSHSEKQFWYDKAERMKFEHNQKHPHYQYKPAKRGPVTKRRQPISREEAVEHCDNMRRMYLPHTESVIPEPSTPRRRPKRKSSDKVDTPYNYSELDYAAPTPRSPPQYQGPAFTEPLIRPPSPTLPLDCFTSNPEVMNAFSFPDETWMPSFEKDPETDGLSGCLIPMPLDLAEDVIEEQQMEESVPLDLPSREAQHPRSPQLESMPAIISTNWKRDHKHFPRNKHGAFHRQRFLVSPQSKASSTSGPQVSACPQDASSTATDSRPNNHEPTSDDNYLVSSIFPCPEEKQSDHCFPVGTTSFESLPMSCQARFSPNFHLRPFSFSAEAFLRYTSDANTLVFPLRKSAADAPNGSMLSDSGVSLPEEPLLNDVRINSSMRDPASGGFMLADRGGLLQEPLSNDPSYADGLPPSAFMLSHLGIPPHEPLFNDQHFNLTMDGLQPTGLSESDFVSSPLFSSESTLDWPADKSWTC